MRQSAAKAAAKNLIIYSITNTVTGQRYIGATKQGLARRKGEHIYRFNLGERDHKLYQGMREHGIENFKFSVICNALKAEYLDDLEKLFIERYDTYRNGYNMTYGGDTVSDETREKLRAIHKGRKITWAHKMVEAKRRNGTLGHAMPKGAANKLAKTYIVRLPDGSERRVHGLNQFCKEHGLSTQSMLQILQGRQKSHRGYSLLARFND